MGCLIVMGTIASNLLDKYLFCNICKEQIKNMVGIEELEKTKREHAACNCTSK